MTHIFKNVSKDKSFITNQKINLSKDVQLYKLTQWFICIKNVRNFTSKSKGKFKKGFKSWGIIKKIWKIFIIILLTMLPLLFICMQILIFNFSSKILITEVSLRQQSHQGHSVDLQERVGKTECLIKCIIMRKILKE